MINLDDTKALNRIAAALERIAAAAELAFFYLGLDPEKDTREQSNEKGNSNESNTETAEEV